MLMKVETITYNFHLLIPVFSRFFPKGLFTYLRRSQAHLTGENVESHSRQNGPKTLECFREWVGQISPGLVLFTIFFARLLFTSVPFTKTTLPRFGIWLTPSMLSINANNESSMTRQILPRFCSNTLPVPLFTLSKAF